MTQIINWVDCINKNIGYIINFVTILDCSSPIQVRKLESQFRNMLRNADPPININCKWEEVRMLNGGM